MLCLHARHPQTAPALPGRRRPGAGGSPSNGFTIVEVMIASVILVVGFVGMIEGVGLGSKMMDASRRQTIAAQILNHEIEKLRLESWTTIQNLSTSTTWSSGTGYAVGDVVSYQGGWFACAIANTNHTPAESSYWTAYMTWGASTAYSKSNLVSYNGTWYWCSVANTAQLPTNTSYWTVYSGSVSSDTNAGATYTLTRTVSDIVSGSLREVTFTVTWVVTTNRLKADGTPLTFTYTRGNSSWFGKYGLNLTYQRS